MVSGPLNPIIWGTIEAFGCGGLVVEAAAVAAATVAVAAVAAA